MGDLRDSPALVDLREVKLEFSSERFIEDGPLPGDAHRSGTTWRYVNRGGGPDRRFSDNPQLPVMLYGQIDLNSSGGLWERLHISDAMKGAEFSDALSDHLSAVRQGPS